MHENMKKLPRSVILMTTHDCNLDCVYCFEKEKSHQKKMSLDLAISILRKEFEICKENGITEIHVDFGGGEPLLNFELIKGVVEFIHQECPLSFGSSFATNATLLNDEHKAFFDKYGCVQISFSIDGTKEAHDINRNNSYDKVVSHVPWLVKRSYPGVKMTIGPDTIKSIAAGVKNLHALGFKEVHANLPYEDLWGDEQNKVELLRIFSKQLEELVEFYLENLDLKPPFLINLPIFKIFNEEVLSDDELFPSWCGGGIYMVAYDVDGKTYPCHRFLPLTTTAAKKFEANTPCLKRPTVREMREKNNACCDCLLLPTCQTCSGNNWELTGDPYIRTRYTCEFHFMQAFASARYQMLKAEKLLSNPDLDKEERSRQFYLMDHAIKVSKLLNERMTASV